MKTTLSNSQVSITVNHKGAELISLQGMVSKKEYIWEGDPKFWGKHSPILFPIVGTLKNNCFTYDNKIYQLPRHGFARDKVFNLISEGENELIFSLQSDEETVVVYPFEFDLQVIYRLEDSEVTISYRVFNKGSEVMYYSIGGHPAFALPNSFEKYSLQFETEEKLVSYALDNDLLSDKMTVIALEKNQLPLTYSLFEKDALIFKEMQSKQIQLLEGDTPILNFKFKDFPNFGIWTKNNAPFICLEPWVGYSDVIDTNGTIVDKEGIQTLESDTSKEYSFSIEIF